MIVRIDYPQPGVRLDLWGGTSGTFNGLDPFNRVTDQRWQNGTGGTRADIDLNQSRSSNKVNEITAINENTGADLGDSGVG
jgi:hypothetical protein